MAFVAIPRSQTLPAAVFACPPRQPGRHIAARFRRLINGSPQNSISAVVAEPWGNQAPDLSLIGPAAAAPPQ